MPFAEILGHDHVIDMLRRSLLAGRLAHAYIFEGPAGTGRRKTAIAMIQTLFCREKRSDACGICSACRKVAAGNHADIHLLAPLPDKKDIVIDQIRELQYLLSLRPYEAERKVCLVEPADRMNTSSANSFLKTLEEPPGNALIVLLTENADSLLPTIRSRCQLVRFAPLASEHIASILLKTGVDEVVASVNAEMSGGSMTRAMLLENDGVMEQRELLLGYMEKFDLNRIKTIFDASEKLSGTREDSLAILDTLLSFMRDVVLMLAGDEGITNSNLRGRLAGFSRKITLDRGVELAEEIARTRAFVLNNANVKLAFDALFIKIAGAFASPPPLGGHT